MGPEFTLDAAPHPNQAHMWTNSYTHTHTGLQGELIDRLGLCSWIKLEEGGCVGKRGLGAVSFINLNVYTS